MTSRAIPLLLATLTLAACAAPPADDAPTSDPHTATDDASAGFAPGATVTTTTTVNFRSGPSTSAAVLDVLPEGTALTVTDGNPQGGFYAVDRDGAAGFVSGKYLVLAPSSSSPAPAASWTTLGTGVSYRSAGDGADVLIAYGGYTAADAYSKGWIEALDAAVGARLHLGHLYAVRGPNQSGYANREIGNSKLAAHLAGVAGGASHVYVVAHSSGSFVSAELLDQIRGGTGGIAPSVLGKIELFDLDGGGLPSSESVRALGHAFFVYAHDATIDRSSENASSMQSLGSTWASKGGVVEVHADGSGCSATASGGLWCLHDTLVTTRPHDPMMYDLADDYVDFGGDRRVVTSYFDALGD